MPRLTIIRDDNAVYVDGRCLTVDCSTLPENVRAVQWNGTTGHIEYDQELALMPTPIDNIDAYQAIIAAWENVRSAADAPLPEPSLSELKTALSRRVDADAEATRLRYITPGEGMMLTYTEKHAQARAVIALGETIANALNDAERHDQFPTLSASVGIEAPTLWGCAQLVVARYEAFADLSAVIERTRLSGKKAISDASDAASARAAYEAITWTV